MKIENHIAELMDLTKYIHDSIKFHFTLLSFSLLSIFVYALGKLLYFIFTFLYLFDIWLLLLMSGWNSNYFS